MNQDSLAKFIKDKLDQGLTRGKIRRYLFDANFLPSEIEKAFEQAENLEDSIEQEQEQDMQENQLEQDVLRKDLSEEKNLSQEEKIDKILGPQNNEADFPIPPTIKSESQETKNKKFNLNLPKIELPKINFPKIELSKIPFKKFSKPILIIFVLIFVGGFTVFAYKKIWKIDPISLLPDKALFYARIKIDSKDQQVKNFNELLSKFPNYQVLNQRIKAEFERIKQENPVLRDIDFSGVSNEIILSSIDLPDENPQDISLVLILPNPNFQKAKQVITSFQDLNKETQNWNIEREDYKGREVIKVSATEKYKNNFPDFYGFTPELDFFVAYTDGHIVISAKIQDLKKIIDTADSQKISNILKKDKQQNITQTIGYEKIQKYLPQDYLAFFYSEFGWSEILKITEQAKTLAQVNNTLLSFESFDKFLKASINTPFAQAKENQALEIAVALAIMVDENGLSAETHYLDLAEQTFLPPQFSLEHSLSNFIPSEIENREVVFYKESKNLKSFFEELEKNSAESMDFEQKQKFEQEINNLNEALGVDLKQDILSLFEENYAFFIASESTGAEIPCFAFIFEIQDENQTKDNLLKINMVSVEKEQLKTKDAAIQSNMAELRAEAEIFYTETGSYYGFSCDYNNMPNICANLEEYASDNPRIQWWYNDYCSYVILNEPSAYYCVDSTGIALKTYIDPSVFGYCGGSTLVCPKEIGQNPNTQDFEKNTFIQEVIQGFEIYSLPIVKGDEFGFNFDLGLNFAVKDKKLILTLTKQELIDILKSLDAGGQKLKQSEMFSAQFQKVPGNIGNVSFSYPYGFIGLVKYGVNLSAETLDSFFIAQDPDELFSEMIIPVIFEFLDKGIAPYLKTLKTTGSYSFAPEKGLIITKTDLTIKELDIWEKQATEHFWFNIENWFEEKSAVLNEKFGPIVPF
ncbi:MAG: DUF3352 domain-containing protein [Candidatus Pacebacteria bacterium]|nr:DUF3352 domain-containing protein [Candidatus Paceibacterota bacterium]